MNRPLIYTLSAGFILLLGALQAGAQTGKDTLISGDFPGISFREFATRIESATPYELYFDSTDIDSLLVTISVKDQPLDEVLDQVFLGTGLRYVITSGRQVFISKGFALRTGLPPHFFENVPDTTGLSAYLQGFQPETRNHLTQINQENKLFNIGPPTNHLRSGNVSVAGYVRDGQTGEVLSGAIIYTDHPNIEVHTNRFGFYSLILPRGDHILHIIGPGMSDTRRHIMLYSEGTLDIDLDEKVLSLKEVTIESQKAGNVKSTNMGVQQLNIASIKQIPTAFGETDILRAVLTLPGVQSVGEASTGFNVRGGATDQNLILFNDATIYNPSHFFGFFSAFDPDLVRDVTLYSSSIPAKYGGRLSSVLDINSLEGNSKKISGSAGIGPLTSKITLDGPLGKKTTFIAGVRTTYSDWLLGILPKQYRNSRASFYDATLHITHKIDDKNSLYFTGYLSQDSFNLNGDTTYSYGNRNANVKWKHVFSNNLFGVMTVGYDRYQYQVNSTDNPVQGFRLGYDINQYNAKFDFTYYLSAKHTLDFGMDNIFYRLYPGEMDPFGKSSLLIADTLQAEQAVQTSFYLSDEYIISGPLSVDYGIRYSLYDYLGPRTVYTYIPGQPRETENILDTLHYGPMKSVKTYGGPEFRVAAKYTLTDESSVKVSFNTMRQYISMLSNTTASFPTDIWKLSDTYIKPQLGQQVSMGYYRNLKSNTIETSVEVYYKWIQNYLDYKSGAVLLMNPQVETAVINTVGKDYGVEFLIRKLTGKLNGWISYTYSRSQIREDDPIAGETVNFGNWYPTNYDKPNDLNFNGNYRVTHRFSLSLSLTYSTGRPITLPIGLYDYGGSARALYSERNQYRIPDYFRTDFSMNIDGNHKVHQLTHNSWTIGVYNLTGRKNAYSVYFISQNGTVNGYQLSIFGTAIPFITYNIKF